MPYDALLRQAAGGDEERLERMRAAVAAGTPAPYVAGFLIFLGQRFRIDRRAFITDPETSALIDVVLAEGDSLAARLGRAPRLLEFSVLPETVIASSAAGLGDWHIVQPAPGLSVLVGQAD